MEVWRLRMGAALVLRPLTRSGGMSVKQHIQSIAIGAALFTLGALGCGSSSSDSGPLSNVDSLIILQRPKRNDVGNVFAYDSYKPGARLIQLKPPAANGTVTPICCG